MQKFIKMYKNVKKPPIFANQEIIEVCQTAELLLLIRALNTIFTHILSEFETISLKWDKACGVERQVTYGSPSFNGNHSRKLLYKVQVLRKMVEGQEELEEQEELGEIEEQERQDCLKYVIVFENLNKVVDSCFTVDLKENYEQLKKPVNPKKDCCSKTKHGLGFYSEQTENQHIIILAKRGKNMKRQKSIQYIGNDYYMLFVNIIVEKFKIYYTLPEQNSYF